jgi:hypothetical protein
LSAPTGTGTSGRTTDSSGRGARRPRRSGASPGRREPRSFHGRDIRTDRRRARAQRLSNAILTPVEGLGGARRRRPCRDHLHRSLRKRLTGFPRVRAAARPDAVVAGASRVCGGFGESPPRTAFWYANSSALVEVAVDQGSAAQTLGLEIGMPVAWR